LGWAGWPVRAGEGASCIRAWSLSSMAVSAWFTSSCGSRATRLRSSSWARRTSRPLRRRSASMRWRRRLKVMERRCTSSISPPAGGSSKLAKSAGSSDSSRSISSSSGEKRRRTIMMLASSASMIAMASRPIPARSGVLGSRRIDIRLRPCVLGSLGLCPLTRSGPAAPVRDGGDAGGALLDLVLGSVRLEAEQLAQRLQVDVGAALLGGRLYAHGGLVKHAVDHRARQRLHALAVSVRQRLPAGLVLAQHALDDLLAAGAERRHRGHHVEA